MPDWPDWWAWELELSAHILKRMVDRLFNESDRRSMLKDATGYHSDIVRGRWAIVTRHAGRSWEVVVEPLADERVLLVVTAYPVGECRS